MCPAVFFFFQAEDGIRDGHVTGVQTCALPISKAAPVMEARRNTSLNSYIASHLPQVATAVRGRSRRSEERRVGKECGSRWGPQQKERRGMEVRRQRRENEGVSDGLYAEEGTID